MRLLTDTLVAVMLLGLLAGVVIHKRTDARQEASREFVRDEVRRFQREINLQRALEPGGLQEYPQTVDPTWFAGNLPKNPLLGAAHPWVEVATSDQKQLLHPIERTTNDVKVARFWYNPHFGIVRARVPLTVSDHNTLDLYNFINNASLDSLYE